MGVYTKTGDKGETGTFLGQRVPKSSKLINTIGTIDELNSFLGIINSELQKDEGANPQDKTSEKIQKIQGNLFSINAILSGSNLKFSKTETKKLEGQIDEWETKLPVQKNFLYYGGSKVSSLLFFARALCRKSERSLVSLSKTRHISPNILIYINRLSDYLFVMARVINLEKKIKDTYWKPGNK